MHNVGEQTSKASVFLSMEILRGEHAACCCNSVINTTQIVDEMVTKVTTLHRRGKTDFHSIRGPSTQNASSDMLVQCRAHSTTYKLLG